MSDVPKKGTKVKIGKTFFCSDGRKMCKLNLGFRVDVDGSVKQTKNGLPAPSLSNAFKDWGKEEQQEFRDRCQKEDPDDAWNHADEGGWQNGGRH